MGPKWSPISPSPIAYIEINYIFSLDLDLYAKFRFNLFIISPSNHTNVLPEIKVYFYKYLNKMLHRLIFCYSIREIGHDQLNISSSPHTKFTHNSLKYVKFGTFFKP